LDSIENPPRTWLMLGGKAGDNTQITALAEGLGWPFETRRMAYRRTEILTNLLAGPTVAGLVPERSDPLQPPWPELVISAGRRNEPLIRWIQLQAARDPALPRVRLVHVGRPWALHECFDLIVTTPQYRLPEKPNILHNELPLQRVNAGRLQREAAAWQGRLAHLPGPHIALLMGGHAGPYNFDRENGALLGCHASRMAAERGGSLLVTTSARTPEAAIDAFASQLRVPHSLHRFVRFQPPEENPFFAFLGMASEIIVTSDSMSMLAEAVATGKPTHIFDLARGPRSNRPRRPADGSIAPRALEERLADFRTQAIMYKIGMHAVPRRLTRDVRIIHDRQVAAGRAVWLGHPWPDDRPNPPPLTDLPRAVEAVRRLFGPNPPPPPVLPESRWPELIQRVFQG
jgi:mitochondrial fission protein ELM1